MATQSKRWPNHAEWARCDAIAAARSAVRLVNDCLDGIDNPVILRRLDRVKDELHKIETKLMAVGPREQENGDTTV